MSEFQMSAGEYDAMCEAIDNDECGPLTVFRCNVAPADTLAVRRVGAEGSTLGGRVAVGATMEGYGVTETFYLAAAQARQMAAALLDAADGLDGVTPLVFYPRSSTE